MKILAEKMLVGLALLALAASVSDSLLINKCKLRDQLNQILPANTMGRVNKVAKIVCHVELSTGFNSTAISQITAPAVYTSRPPIGRRGRSILGSSSEESSENLIRMPTTPKNVTSKQNTTAAPTYTKPFPGNEGKNNGTVPKFPKIERGHGGRHGRSAPGPNHKPKSDFHSAPPKKVTSRPHSTAANFTKPFPGNEGKNNGTVPKFPKKERGHGGRHGRSAPGSNHKPKSDFHSAPPKKVKSRPHTTAANFTQTFPGNGSCAANATKKNDTDKEHEIKNPKHNYPEKGRGHGGRRDRSTEDSSSEESGEEDVWTLYGLFQLPDRIACVSEGVQSLNLCNMSCNKLIDDDITDDLACLGIIIRRALSGGGRPGPTNELIKIYYAGLFQKKCSNVVASKYFSTC